MSESPQKEKNELVARYENNPSGYFDVSEMEEIVEYYMQEENPVKARKAIRQAISMHGPIASLCWTDLTTLMDEDNYEQVIKLGRQYEPYIAEAGDEMMIDTTRLMIAESLYLSGKEEEAEKIFEDLLSHSDSYDLDKFKEVCYIYEEAEEPEKALAVMERAYEKFPDDEEIITSLASHLDKAGQFKRAIELWNKALDIDTHNDGLWLALGKSQLLDGNADGAIEALEYALSLHPDDIVIKGLLGGAYAMKGDNVKAAEGLIEAASTENADNSFVATFLPSAAECYKNAEEYDMAIETCYLILSKGVFSTETVLLLKDCLIQCKRYLEALFVAQTAVARFPNDKSFKMILGDVYNEAFEDPEQAIHYYLAAMKEGENNTHAYLSAIFSYVDMGKGKEARDLLDKFEAESTDYNWIAVTKAVVEYKFGDKALACRLIKEAMENGNEDAAAKFAGICPDAKDMLQEQGIKIKDAPKKSAKRRKKNS